MDSQGFNRATAESAAERLSEEDEWTDDAREEEDDVGYESSTEDEREEIVEALEQLLEEQEEVDSDNDNDATGGTGNSAIELYLENGNTAGGGVAQDGITDVSLTQRARILRILAGTNIGRLFMRSLEDDDGNEFVRFGRLRRTPLDPSRFPKVPSDIGIDLMHSGNFGTNKIQSTNAEKELARRILDRELGTDSGPRQKVTQGLMTQNMIPSSNADVIIHYDSPVYSGQFSDDGNFFFACVKDFKVRMYDTSNPYKWRYYKTVEYPFGQWTLTDATLTPDNKYLAYASIQPKVCLAPTDPNNLGDPYTLDLSDNRQRSRASGFFSRHGSFGVWSMRFSGEGRELVAGTSANSIIVYDIESRRTVLEIPGHDEDVNAVCFGDASSPHIIYSGSDDTTLKVWDRRSMGDSREAGAFCGHTEGLTYIDSKGDGRYILSNAKDQSMKLWDLRMVMSTAKFALIDPTCYTTQFDYRWGSYDEDDYAPHPHDNSLVTFRGHRVLRTLIRCHFSPPGSSDSRYVYSGSEDGKIYIYNLDATLAAKIDVLAATKDSRPNEINSSLGSFHNRDNVDIHSMWRTCVRDASWHPHAPIIAASSWNGFDRSYGTVSLHSWNEGSQSNEVEPISVNDKLEQDESLHF